LRRGYFMSTHIRPLAIIPAEMVRFAIILTLCHAALTCPMLCAEDVAACGSAEPLCTTDLHDQPATPADHDRPCDDSCFCAAANPPTSINRSLSPLQCLDVACIAAAPQRLDAVAQAAAAFATGDGSPRLLADDRPLPLLI